MEQFLAHGVDQIRADFRVPQLVFRLRLEDRVLQSDGHRPNHALAHVVPFKLALGVLVDRLEKPLAERAQMGAAVPGELAVDK